MGKRKNRRTGKSEQPSISALTVKGFKSIRDETRLEIRPLTILAGANSTGKSSIMQPLLLLKQTIEATYDPGPLLLDGPNVRFRSARQLFWGVGGEAEKGCFTVGLEVASEVKAVLTFQMEGKELTLGTMKYTEDGSEREIRPGMTEDEIVSLLPKYLKGLYDEIKKPAKYIPEWRVSRVRCFYALVEKVVQFGPLLPVGIFEACLRGTIHVPALRGNPQPEYARSGVGPMFSGEFQDYVASILLRWKEKKDNRLRKIGRDLHDLDLTWKVDVKPIDDTKLEVRVGRLRRCQRGGARDLVNIAVVGFGLSQVLPVLVALAVAKPGQLVYIEQPEIHLHPSAQVAMATVLADAAKRGIRVVVETHSALLLLGVQTLVARGDLDPALVALHWFERDKEGATHVHAGELDERGRFGDWPQDFGKLELNAEKEYLDAARL